MVISCCVAIALPSSHSYLAHPALQQTCAQAFAIQSLVLVAISQEFVNHVPHDSSTFDHPTPHHLPPCVLSFNHFKTSAALLSGGNTGYHTFTILPFSTASVNLLINVWPLNSNVGSFSNPINSNFSSDRSWYGRCTRSFNSRWYAVSCVLTPKIWETPPRSRSPAASRNEQACGVQPRAPGIAFHESGTVSFGPPVRG